MSQMGAGTYEDDDLEALENLVGQSDVIDLHADLAGELFKDDARSAGFGLPDDLDPWFERGPGWAATALFAWQAWALRRDDLAADTELAPLLGDLLEIINGAATFEDLVAELEAAWALDVAAWHQALLVTAALEDADVADICSWLLDALWAMSSARAGGSRWIASVYRIGGEPHWERCEEEGPALDRFLLRANLNEAPLIDDPMLASALPRRTEDWLLATGEIVERLEQDFISIEEGVGGRTMLGSGAGRSVVELMPGYTLITGAVETAGIGQRQRTQAVLMTPYGTTVLDTIVSRCPEERLELEEVLSLPWIYAGLEYEAVLSILARQIAASVGSGNVSEILAGGETRDF